MGRACHCPDCRFDRVGDVDCCALYEYEELEQRLRAQESYLLQLMQYMSNRDARIQGLKPAISVWTAFKREYPSSANDLEHWLKKRHAN